MDGLSGIRNPPTDSLHRVAPSADIPTGTRDVVALHHVAKRATPWGRPRPRARGAGSRVRPQADERDRAGGALVRADARLQSAAGLQAAADRAQRRARQLDANAL